tara:strand:+ start:416 stop:583 length:168 start_codon:yes stop_codon:yes gene_type:complete
MKPEGKQELIKILSEENQKLKNDIASLKQRASYLEERIAGLMAENALPRRGMPWS